MKYFPASRTLINIGIMFMVVTTSAVVLCAKKVFKKKVQMKNNVRKVHKVPTNMLRMWKEVKRFFQNQTHGNTFMKWNTSHQKINLISSLKQIMWKCAPRMSKRIIKVSTKWRIYLTLTMIPGFLEQWNIWICITCTLLIKNR